MFDNADIIYSYSRAQAITDGVLVDLSHKACKHGFKIPFACTDTVWQEIAWTENDKAGSGQSTDGRLSDLLHMAILAAAGAKDANQVEVKVLLVPRSGDSMIGKLHIYKLHIGPGDKGEPVITLMQLNED